MRGSVACDGGVLLLVWRGRSLVGSWISCSVVPGDRRRGRLRSIAGKGARGSEVGACGVGELGCCYRVAEMSPPFFFLARGKVEVFLISKKAHCDLVSLAG